MSLKKLHGKGDGSASSHKGLQDLDLKEMVFRVVMDLAHEDDVVVTQGGDEFVKG
jgi:hypothetical protein